MLQRPPLSGAPVLLVDDDALVLRATSRALERAGLQVLAFSEPLQALSTFQGAPDRFALVVTDLTMPGLTGTELARAVHALRPEVPVVLVSGRLDADDLSSVNVLALSKPLSMETLLHHIREQLAGAGYAPPGRI